MTGPRDELSDGEAEILDAMDDGKRVNTHYLAEQTSLERDRIPSVLADLVAADHVREVSRDLYVRTPEGDSTAVHHGIPDPNPETQTAPIDPTEFEDGGEE